MALKRLVFVPFGYLVDKYRWDLYSGSADESNMNCHWVKLRMDIQGNQVLVFTSYFLSYHMSFHRCCSTKPSKRGRL